MTYEPVPGSLDRFLVERAPFDGHPQADALRDDDEAEYYTGWPDITDELELLEFYLSSDYLEDDARFHFLELERRFEGHPALATYAARFATDEGTPPWSRSSPLERRFEGHPAAARFVTDEGTPPWWRSSPATRRSANRRGPRRSTRKRRLRPVYAAVAVSFGDEEDEGALPVMLEEEPEAAPASPPPSSRSNESLQLRAPGVFVEIENGDVVRVVSAAKKAAQAFNTTR